MSVGTRNPVLAIIILFRLNIDYIGLLPIIYTNNFVVYAGINPCIKASALVINRNLENRRYLEITRKT